jgi:hypothetical protein
VLPLYGHFSPPFSPNPSDTPSRPPIHNSPSLGTCPSHPVVGSAPRAQNWTSEICAVGECFALIYFGTSPCRVTCDCRGTWPEQADMHVQTSCILVPGFVLLYLLQQCRPVQSHRLPSKPDGTFKVGFHENHLMVFGSIALQGRDTIVTGNQRKTRRHGHGMRDETI